MLVVAHKKKSCLTVHSPAHQREGTSLSISRLYSFDIKANITSASDYEKIDIFLLFSTCNSLRCKAELLLILMCLKSRHTQLSKPPEWVFYSNWWAKSCTLITVRQTQQFILCTHKTWSSDKFTCYRSTLSMAHWEFSSETDLIGKFGIPEPEIPSKKI